MKRIIIFILMLAPFCLAQVYHRGKSYDKTQITKDEYTIIKMVKNLVASVQNDRTDAISKYLASGDYAQKFRAKGEVFVDEFFTLTSEIKVTVSENNATAVCTFADKNDQQRQETFSFVRLLDKWKINGSTFFLHFALQKSNKREKTSSALTPLLQTDLSLNVNNLKKFKIGKSLSDNQNVHKINESKSLWQNNESSIINSVTSFILSNKALIKKNVIYSSSYLISKQYTQNNLGRSLFGKPTSGKILMVNGGYAISIFGDEQWNRIVLGNYTTNDIISYGDNSGDERFGWPKGVSMDKFGNIFLIANSPVEVIRLKYNEVLNTITYIGKVPIYLVQDPVDLCLDDNNTPDNTADDSFWLADKQDNSILRFTWSGTLLGKYFRFGKTFEEETVDFINPTKILINYDIFGYLSVTVIDNNKQRVIIIPMVSSLTGNAIKGDAGNYSTDDPSPQILAVQFGGNTSISSIAHNGFDHGVCVTDESSGMMHILDGFWGTGYLGSVQTLSDGVSLWNSPKFAVTTYMSNSYGYLPGSRNDLRSEILVMDKWSSTNGISNFYLGCDILEPYTTTSGATTVHVNGSLTNDSWITSKIFKDYSTTPIHTFSQSSYITGKHRIFNYTVPSRLGLYEFRFTLEPISNNQYGTFTQPPLNKSYYFSFPVDGILNGPSSGLVGTNLTWNLNLTSGSGWFYVFWYKRNQGSSTWEYMSDGDDLTSITWPMANHSFELRCDVYDMKSTSSTKTFTKNVSCITTSGTISSNENWEGAVNLAGSVTVPSGLTLTLQPGTIVKFPSGASLTANGRLTAVGTPSSKITFTTPSGTGGFGNWGFIFLDGSGASGSVLNNIVMKYGTEIKVNNVPNFSVQNSSIENTINGINSYASTGSVVNSLFNMQRDHGIVVGNASTISCENNTITKLDKSGAAILYTAGAVGWGNYAFHNQISGYNWGITSSYGSNVRLGNYWASYESVNNSITNCSRGIYVYQSSSLNMSDDGFGYNSVYDNTPFNTYVATNSSVDAYYNYWGWPVPTSKFYIQSGSYFGPEYALDYNPWYQGQQFVNTKEKENSVTESVVNISESQRVPRKLTIIERGRNLRKEGKFQEAFELFKKAISSNERSNDAILEIAGLHNREFETKVEDFLLSLSPDNLPLSSYLYSLLQVKNRKNEKAISSSKRVPVSSSLSRGATLTEFYINLYSKKDFEKSEKILSKITSLGEDDIELTLAHHDFASYITLSGNDQSFHKKSSSAIEIKPVTYELSQNYPNPFNPSTTISYQIPVAGVVSLKVFDVLGKEIASLVNEYRQEGKYSVEFNANHLASGTYVVRMKSRDYTKTMKLTLLK